MDIYVTYKKYTQTRITCAARMESDEGKNPVSLINEYCQLRHTLPIFKKLNEDGEPHVKVFTVSCEVLDDKTTGTGRSVKQARTNSAQNMLEKLKNGGLLSADFQVNDKKKHTFGNLSDSNLKAKIADNPVGCLQEYCISAKIPLPVYTDDMTSSGFRTICKVNDITCEGFGKQKRLSKSDSARKVCEILFKQLNKESNVNGTDEHEKTEEDMKEVDEEPKNHILEIKSEELNNDSGEVSGMK